MIETVQPFASKVSPLAAPLVPVIPKTSGSVDCLAELIGMRVFVSERYLEPEAAKDYP